MESCRQGGSKPVGSKPVGKLILFVIHRVSMYLSDAATCEVYVGEMPGIERTNSLSLGLLRDMRTHEARILSGWIQYTHQTCCTHNFKYPYMCLRDAKC